MVDMCKITSVSLPIKAVGTIQKYFLDLGLPHKKCIKMLFSLNSLGKQLLYYSAAYIGAITVFRFSSVKICFIWPEECCKRVGLSI